MRELDRPVVVTGTPRSGKSLVAEILAHDPTFQHLSEPLTIWSTGASFSRHSRRTADQATPRIRRRILKVIHRLSEPGRRYLDDLAHHALRIPFLVAVLPQVRIVYVIRDGRQTIPEIMFGWTYSDTLVSALTRRWREITFPSAIPHVYRFTKNYVLSRLTGRRATWGPRVPGLAKFVKDHDIAEIAAFQWKYINEIALEDLARIPPQSWLQVRFEDILNDPVEQTRRIADFCQVHNADALVEFAQKHIDPNFVSQEKTLPTPAQWQAIGRIIDPFQIRLGYPPVSQGLPPPARPAAAPLVSPPPPTPPVHTH